MSQADNLAALGSNVNSSGVLQPASGGTGATAFPSPGTAGNVLTSNGSAWTSAAIASSQWITTGSNIYYNTGNVGIGTSSPSYKVDVNGRTRSADFGMTNNTQNYYHFDNFTGNNFMGLPSTSTLGIYIAGAERMRITSGGDVGIGTSSPSKKLSVVGSSGDIIQATDNTNGSIFIGTNSTGPYVYASSGSVLRFGGNSEYARFDTSGNFSFNSGYGSVAIAYGCRAWVSFNGTGTPAIRGSGNVSSITDDGTGRFRVNFTNAMPDTNYSAVAIGRAPGTVTAVSSLFDNSGAYSTTQVAVSFYGIGDSAYIDPSIFNVVIYR